MIIEKNYGDEPGIWEETTVEQFLSDTEETEYWRPGTALQALKDTGHVHTPWAQWRIKDESHS